jgi:hypothetical protein
MLIAIAPVFIAARAHLTPTIGYFAYKKCLKTNFRHQGLGSEAFAGHDAIPKRLQRWAQRQLFANSLE